MSTPLTVTAASHRPATDCCGALGGASSAAEKLNAISVFIGPSLQNKKAARHIRGAASSQPANDRDRWLHVAPRVANPGTNRKSTRLNSSHMSISYAVFCLKKKINSQYEI